MLWWRRQVRNEGMNGGDARMNLWNWEFCVHFLLSVLPVRTNRFFLAPQVKAHAYDSFFFSSTFIDKSNIWVNNSNICEVPSKWCKCLGWSGTYKLELLRKNSAKKTFKKLNFEIITKNIWITNSKTIVSISVKLKKQNTPYNVNFKINEMLILVFIKVFI